MNNISLVGRITGKMTVTATQNSTVGNFMLAVKRGYKSKAVDYIPCKIWGDGADVINQYAGDAKVLALTGQLQSDSYTDKEGHKRTAYAVNVGNFNFVYDDDEDSQNK